MKTLAIVQIILGALVVGSLLVFVIWIEPGFYHIRLPVDDSGLVKEVFLNPGRNIPMRTWETVSFLLGLAVLGCGIAQFVKARGKG